MTAPLLTKAWTITPNVRNAYVSLSTMAGWWFYQNHIAIKAKWTLKCTSDGVTGPANLADATDRLTDATKTATQGAAAGNAQSWALYTNADGVQLLIANQGATADVLRIGYSRAAGYVLAATTNQQPTATDEVAIATGTIVGAGLSLDRVMSIWVRDDGRAWSCATFRSAALQSCVGFEQVTSLATVRVTNPIFDVPYAIYRYTLMTRGGGQGVPTGTSVGGGALGPYGTYIRCYTDSARMVGLGGGELIVSAASTSTPAVGGTFNNDKPAAQDSAATPLIPIYWSGLRLANTDGLFASPIDWYVGYGSTTTTPAPADTFSGYDPGDDTSGVARANWWVAIGACMVRPWRNVAVGMSTS